MYGDLACRAVGMAPSTYYRWKAEGEESRRHARSMAEKAGRRQAQRPPAASTGVIQGPLRRVQRVRSRAPPHHRRGGQQRREGHPDRDRGRARSHRPARRLRDGRAQVLSERTKERDLLPDSRAAIEILAAAARGGGPPCSAGRSAAEAAALWRHRSTSAPPPSEPHRGAAVDELLRQAAEGSVAGTDDEGTGIDDCVGIGSPTTGPGSPVTSSQAGHILRVTPRRVGQIASPGRCGPRPRDAIRRPVRPRRAGAHRGRRAPQRRGVP